MSRYRICPATRAHVAAIVPLLRSEDRAELAAAGVPPVRFLLRLYERSEKCWAAFVDEELALVGGLEADFISPEGRPWLFTTPAIERVPVAFAKEARRWLAEVLQTRSRLLTACLASYERSSRLWVMLGFRVDGVMRFPGKPDFLSLVMERP